MDSTLTGSLGQSGPGTSGNVGVIHIRQGSRTTASPLNAVPGDLTPPQR